MWNRTTGVLCLMVVLFFAAPPGMARDEVRKERVQFEKGASGADIKGTITGYETVDYLLGARAGQTMSVSMTTDNGANYFNVLPPDSENEAVFNGSTSENRYEGRLDLDGDWKIRVYMMRSAARRDEVANYTLKVGISGSPDPAVAREASTFGPLEYDASGYLGCTTGGAPMQPGACPFKVIRNDYGATIYVLKPGGQGTRILYFDSGKWSTDSAAEVKTTKRADMWVLIVEEETYEVPEAVITGG